MKVIHCYVIDSRLFFFCFI